MDYKKIVILVVCLLIPFVQGVEIGVVVDFPDGQTHGECIKTNTGTNGYEVLKKLSLTTLWSDPASFGHQLCKVKGIGDDVSGSTCEYVGNYWRFFIQKNNKWEYMPIGFDAGNSCWNQDLNSFNGHYCAKEGEVIGLSYGAFDAPLPQIKSFDDICNTLAISDVKVYVDGKKESDADESGGDIQARPSSKIEIEVEIENLGQTQVEDVKGEIIIKDIDGGSNKKEPLSFNDLEDGEDDKDTATFTIPLILEDDSYDIEMEISGKINGVKQTIKVSYDLDLEKEEHDITFTAKELQKDSVCQGEENFLKLTAVNSGEKNEEVLLSIKNQELSLAFEEKIILMQGDEKDSVYQTEFSFKTPNANPGNYSLKINAAYSKNTTDEVTFEIKDCNQPRGFTSILTGKTILNTNSQPSTTSSKQFALPQNTIVMVLIVAIVLFIIAIIVIISMLN